MLTITQINIPKSILENRGSSHGRKYLASCLDTGEAWGYFVLPAVPSHLQLGAERLLPSTPAGTSSNYPLA